MHTFLVAGALIVAFVLLDLVWFHFIGDFFKREIASIARLSAEGNWQVRMLPALGVYVLMSIAIIFLVLPLATSLPHALMLGALFGFVSYGIYDLTNLATLADWTPKFVLVDIAWGTVLCGAGASLAYWLSHLWV